MSKCRLVICQSTQVWKFHSVPYFSYRDLHVSFLDILWGLGFVPFTPCSLWFLANWKIVVALLMSDASSSSRCCCSDQSLEASKRQFGWCYTKKGNAKHGSARFELLTVPVSVRTLLSSHCFWFWISLFLLWLLGLGPFCWPPFLLCSYM